MQVAADKIGVGSQWKVFLRLRVVETGFHDDA
jgi:hypothetical protein